MDMVLSGLTWTSALVYLDDIVVFSTSFDDHLSRLRAVCERLQIANLKIKPTKCQLFQWKVKFLGYVVSADGLETDSEKVEAAAEWPTPPSVTEVRAFVGLCSYYRKVIASFAEIATPLHDLTKKNARFIWETKHETAFRELKSRLISAQILTSPDDSDTYILDTDASDQTLGVLLSQVQKGHERVIAHASRRYADAGSRYCIARRELLAVIYGLRQFRAYLLGRHFIYVLITHLSFGCKEHLSQSVSKEDGWICLLDFPLMWNIDQDSSTTMRMPCPADLADNVDVMIWMTSIRLI
jgi:hypothetical protein